MHEDESYWPRVAAFKEPHAFYMTGEDSLLISMLGSGTTNVIIAGRFLTREGEIKAFERRPSFVASVTTETTQTITLGEGWLLNLTVRSVGDDWLMGRLFCRVDVRRGIEASSVVLATLLQGTFNDLQPLVWPGSPIGNTLTVPGLLRSVTGTDPAAGVEISETVPTGARWRVVAFSFRFVTDATVSNRQVRLLVDDGTTVLFGLDPPANTTASDDVRYNFLQGLERLAVVSDNRQHGLPVGLVLGGGFRIRTNTFNLQAGDNFGAPQLLVEETLEAR